MVLSIVLVFSVLHMFLPGTSFFCHATPSRVGDMLPKVYGKVALLMVERHWSPQTPRPEGQQLLHVASTARPDSLRQQIAHDSRRPRKPLERRDWVTLFRESKHSARYGISALYPKSSRHLISKRDLGFATSLSPRSPSGRKRPVEGLRTQTTPEQNSARSKKSWEARRKNAKETPQQQTAAGKRSWETRRKNFTPEEIGAQQNRGETRRRHPAPAERKFIAPKTAQTQQGEMVSEGSPESKTAHRQRARKNRSAKRQQISLQSPRRTQHAVKHSLTPPQQGIYAMDLGSQGLMQHLGGQPPSIQSGVTSTVLEQTIARLQESSKYQLARMFEDALPRRDLGIDRK